MEASNNAIRPRSAHWRSFIHGLFTRCERGRRGTQDPLKSLFFPLRYDQRGKVVGL